MSKNEGASDQMPTLVETPEALASLLSTIEAVPEISIDIESNGYYNYFERTCILSLSTPDLDFVIDSLALWENMEPLREMLCDRGKRILVHGGSYDVLSLKRDFNFTFPDIRDSLLSATLMGYETLGLAGLVKNQLGIDLPKELQRHNWTERPLKRDELKYLGNDTRFLFPIIHELEAKAIEKDLEEELDLESQYLAAQPYVEKVYSAEESVEKLKDSRRLPPNIRGLLRSIFAWRDVVSRELDIAPFRVLSNGIILSIANNPTVNVDELRERRGIGRYVFDTGIERLASAIEEGMENPFPFVRQRKSERSSNRRNYDELRSLSKAIKQWRTIEADKREIGIQGVLPTPAMKAIVEMLPEDPSELASIERFGNKRLERYGSALVQLVAEYCPSSLRQKASAG